MVKSFLEKTGAWAGWIISILVLGSYLLTMGYSMGSSSKMSVTIEDHETRIRAIEGAEIRTKLEMIQKQVEMINQRLIEERK